MILGDVIKELRERCKEFDEYVAGAADWGRLDLLNNEAPRYPCAYVVPLSDQADTSTSEVAYRQVVTETFAVIVVISIDDDADGVDAMVNLKQVIQPSIFKAILDWTPDSKKYSEVQFAGSEVIYMDRARMAYQFEFTFDYFLDDTDTRHGDDLAALPPIKGVNAEVGIHPDLNPKLTGKVSIKLED